MSCYLRKKLPQIRYRQTDIIPILNEAQTENTLSVSEDHGLANEPPEDGRLGLSAAASELSSRSILGLRDAQHLAASSLINSTQIAALNTTTAAMFVIGVHARGAISEQRLSDIGVLYRKGVAMSLCLGVPALLFTR